MPTRRKFMKRIAGGAAVYAAYGFRPSGRVLGANDRVRFGLIGSGGRGQEILKAALACTNVEAAAVADLYTRRLDQVKQIAPKVKTCQDFRELLDD